MKVERILVDTLYEQVNTQLKNSSNLNALIRSAQGYFDRNSDKLFDTGLTEKVLFLNTDKEAFYKAIRLTPVDIKRVIKQSRYIKDKWKIMNEPLNTAAALILRYLTINKKDKELKVVLTYYSFYFYSSLYHKYLPYGANRNVMDFTVNNLSNKFLLKKLGSLYKTIEHVAINSHDKYKEDLVHGEDGDLANYISALKVRLNDVLKNIKNEYTKNYKQKNYVNYDSDSYDEDNFHLSDNNSYAIKRISDSCIIKLNTYGPDIKLVTLAAKMNQVSQNEIKNVVLHLNEEDTTKIQRMFELILQLFLFDENNKVEEVRTNKFILKCNEIYKKSNTNDRIILEIKAILDEWLEKYSDTYKKTNRLATLSNFRKSIFMYFVFHINQSAMY